MSNPIRFDTILSLILVPTIANLPRFEPLFVLKKELGEKLM